MEANSSTFNSQVVSFHNLPPVGTIIGQSEGMKGLWRIVERVAGASVPILIVGENGTGKEVLARFIHACGSNPNVPFLKVTPPIPDGHSIDEVAFRLDHDGAGGGDDLLEDGCSVPRMCTLFIEEVDEIGPDRQLELLQLIQGFRPLMLRNGSEIPVTVRVIVTSSHGLEQEVPRGKFREDLFWFLSVVTLRLPPLRERKEDIPQLANYFWQIYSEKFGCHSNAPSRQLIDLFQQHDWPGNIRELENAMKRYVVLGAEGVMGMGHATHHQQAGAPESSGHHVFSLKDATRQAAHALERKIILRTLQETQWNRRQTARALNISYRALLYKIKEAGLVCEQPKKAAGNSSIEDQKSNHEFA